METIPLNVSDVRLMAPFFRDVLGDQQPPLDAWWVDGSLNKCIQCDETDSGPLFKQFSGRTRRDSGLTSAIERPPDSIFQVEHYYY